MTRTSRRTTNAIDIIHRRYFAGRPERLMELEEARQSAAIARRLYELRMRAGLTQTQLARMVGTTPSVICRLEDDDYQSHSLTMLRRVARALGCKVEVRFPPMPRRARSA